jgi:hypothetical protein
VVPPGAPLFKISGGGVWPRNGEFAIAATTLSALLANCVAVTCVVT